MVIRIDDSKVTPRQFAKQIMLREIEGAYFWTEHYYSEEASLMSVKEREAVSSQVDKLHRRIKKLLGQP